MAYPVERTALEEFKFGGQRVRAGEVVTIPNARKLKEMVAAGCVVETDEANADVPKRAVDLAGDVTSDVAEQAGNVVHGGDAVVKQQALDKAQKDADTAKDAAVKAKTTATAILAKPDADAATKAKAQTDADKAQADADKAQAALDALKKA